MAQLLSETRMIRYKKKHTHISPNKKSQSGLSIEKKHNKQTTKKNKVLTNPEVFHKKKTHQSLKNSIYLQAGGPGSGSGLKFHWSANCSLASSQRLRTFIQVSKAMGKKQKPLNLTFGFPTKLVLWCALYIYIYIHIQDVFFPFPKRKVF